MKKISLFCLFLIMLIGCNESTLEVGIENPEIKNSVLDPFTFEVNQIVNATVEAERLLQVQTKFDRQLTGLYIPPGCGLTVNVQILTSPADGVLPKLVIGTPRRLDNNVKEIELHSGENIIPASAHSGGMLYLEYTSEQQNPTGQIRVQFSELENSVIRAPYYIKGVTAHQEFMQMVANAGLCPDVTFVSDKIGVVVSVAAAKKYSVNEDLEVWMANIERILEKEDEISGIVANDPNPYHRPMADGIRHLFVEVATGYMYATNQLTGYCGDAALRRLLTNDQITGNCWGISHELGHQHQQAAYKPGNMTETTVNIYTAAVWRMFNPGQVIAAQPGYYANLLNLYFTQSDDVRNYHDDASIGVVSNQNEGRFLFFEQINLLFGPEFFKRLHRITREERKNAGTDDDRIYYLLWKTCEITGYNLTDYFVKWGFRLPDTYWEVLNYRIGQLPVPPQIASFHLVTATNVPSWAPLTLQGISSSSLYDIHPENALLSVSRYCDYSTSTGTVTDSRDGKVYTYKRYGSYDWFTKNLDWDGYNGSDISTRGSVGYYTAYDPTGEVFGRYYPTNSGTASKTWCPAGWRLPTSSEWNNLYAAIKSEYNISDADLAKCMKAGGDRDYVNDGLWKTGAASFDMVRAALVGFNILPAGVYNKNTQGFDKNDEVGAKAAFVESSWWHQITVNTNNNFTRTNRNSHHHASVRCIKNAN